MMQTAAEIVAHVRRLNARGNFDMTGENAVALLEAWAADLLAAQNKIAYGIPPQKLADYLEYGVRP